MSGAPAASWQDIRMIVLAAICCIVVIFSKAEYKVAIGLLMFVEILLAYLIGKSAPHA